MEVVKRYAPEFYTKKDFNSLRKIFFLTVFGRLFLSILFIVILFNNSSILNILKLNTLQDFKIEFVIILITALQIQLIGDTFLVSLLQQKFYNLSYSAYYFLEFLSIYFSVKYNTGLRGLLLVLAACNTFLLLLLLIKSKKILFANSRVNNTHLPFKRILKYCVSTFFVIISYSLVDIWIDNFVINYYIGKEAVAQYGLANVIANNITSISPALLILPILTSVSVSIFTKTSSLNQLKFMYKFYNKIITFFSLPMFVGFILLSDKIVPLFFGEKYSPTIWLINLVVIFSFIRMYTHPLKMIIKILEKVHRLIFGIILSVYNLFMDIILVKAYGVHGVAIATGTTIILSYALMKIIVSSEIKCKFPLRSTIKTIISTIVMSIFIMSFKSYSKNVIYIAAIILISAVIYFAILATLKPFNNRERAILHQSLGKHIKMF